MPDWRSAYIPDDKLAGYLLSETHAVGKWKARLFSSIGYTRQNADLLKERLLKIARENQVRREIRSTHGTKYVVEGILITPEGRPVRLVTIWIVEKRDPRPRFVTAYPA